MGEVTVLAWADMHGATAIIDDAEARRVGRKHHVPVHGTLWIIAETVKNHRSAERGAETLVGTLKAAGARYPCEGHEFVDWAKRQGLLP